MVMRNVGSTPTITAMVINILIGENTAGDNIKCGIYFFKNDNKRFFNSVGCRVPQAITSKAGVLGSIPRRSATKIKHLLS